MKRTDTITKLVSLLLFVALVSYLGIYLVRSMTNDVRTAPAVFLSLSESGTATGMIIRDETLVQSSEQYLNIVAESGKLVSAGETIALAYSGEAALSRASRLHELELRLTYINSVLSGQVNQGSLAQKDNSVKQAIIALAASAARTDTDALASDVLTLSSLVLSPAEAMATQADLTLVNDELSQLKQTALNDTAAIKAPYPALFSTGVDGFEQISPNDIMTGLSPSKLETLSSTPQELPSDVQGKLSSFREWYFASVMTTADASRVVVGGSASLDFGRYCSEPVPARIISISPAEDGMCAVVFRCTSDTSKMLTVRKISAQMVFASHEGLRVPKEAVSSDADGDFLFTLTGVQAEKKYINILWETDVFYLVEPLNDAAALREGNDIILSSRELFDGKLMN